MADTGAPWNIPFAEPTDLVRDWPDLSEDVANAVAAGLNAAGGLVAVKSAIFAGTQTQSLAASANVAITGLEIVHEVEDEDNRLIISGFIGAAGNSEGGGQVGIAVHDGTSLIAIGNAQGNRSRVSAGGRVSGTGTNEVVAMPAITFVHTPGTGSKTYTLRAVNIRNDTRTVYINRSDNDTDSGFVQRAVSALVIQEVKV